MQSLTEAILAGAFYAAVGLIAGAISGSDLNVIAVALLGSYVIAVPTMIFSMNAQKPDAVAYGMAAGWVLGLIPGAIVGVYIKKRLFGRMYDGTR